MSKKPKGILIILSVGIASFLFMYFAIAYRPPVQKTAGYLYDVSDSIMQAAVWKVIKNDSNISVPPIRDANGEVNYYNDSAHFISMTMKVRANKEYQYTLMYYGDSVFRSTSTVSELFIHDSHDPTRQNKETNNLFFAPKEDTLLINAFERTFIDKLDKELGMGHTKEIK